MNCKFKVGDEIKGISNNYGITNKDMKRGKVIGIPSNGKINIEVLEHIDSGWIGGTFTFLGDEDFELVESDQITINRYGNKVVAKMGKKVGIARCNVTDTFDFYTGVKIATERLFGKEELKVKEVKRHAKVGEYIKIVRTTQGHTPNVFIGDIHKIKMVNSDGEAWSFENGFDYTEYVVLENYKPQEKPQKEKPKYYNGKVVCVEKRNDFLTLGKAYEFKDGKSVDGVGDSLPFGGEALTLEYLNRVMISKFIELVE